jgi:integrase
MGVKVKKIRGSWYIRVNYKGHRKTKRIGTSRDVAEDVKRKVEARLALGDLGIFGADDAAKTAVFRDVAERWLKSVAVKRKPSTFQTYESTMRVHVAPVFGARRVDSITDAQVEDFIYALATKKDADDQPVFAQATVALIVAVLRAFFTYARRNKLIASNPAVGLGELPKSAKPGRKGESMTRAQAEKFLDAVWVTTTTPDATSAHEMYAFFLLALRAGLRRGELAGLKWGDFAFGESPEDTDRHILVQRSWSGGRFGTPKSGKSRRVDMSRQAREALVQLRDQRLLAAMLSGKTSIADDLVFTESDGEPLKVETVAARYMEPALTRAGLKRFRLHDLRHTFGSLLIQSGASLVYVKDQMGHSSIKITADTYAHLIPSENTHLIDRLDAVTADAAIGTNFRTNPSKNATQAQTLASTYPPETSQDVDAAVFIASSPVAPAITAY